VRAALSRSFAALSEQTSGVSFYWQFAQFFPQILCNFLKKFFPKTIDFYCLLCYTLDTKERKKG